MRLFTAIDLPPDIIERLDALIAKLRPLAPIRWSSAGNLHITTKFIGQWPEEQLPQLQHALSSVSCRPRIPIQVTGLGFFPNLKSPRVFWAGVNPTRELVVLAGDIDHAVSNLVKPEIRAYSPHLTLARINPGGGLTALRNQVEQLGQPDFGSFAVDRLYLYLSEPSSSGSVYTKLSEFPFTTQ